LRGNGFILEEKSQKRLTLISEMKILQVCPLWICMANALVFQGVNCWALVQEKNMFHFESRPESTNGIPAKPAFKLPLLVRVCSESFVL